MKKLNLQKVLEMKDINVSEFAKMVGINRQSLYYILEDMARTEKHMLRFAAELDINVDILYQFVEEEPKTILEYQNTEYKIFTHNDVNKLMDDILAGIDFD